MAENTKNDTANTPPVEAEDIQAKQEKCSHETVVADRCTDCKKKMV